MDMFNVRFEVVLSERLKRADTTWIRPVLFMFFPKVGVELLVCGTCEFANTLQAPEGK